MDKTITNKLDAFFTQFKHQAYKKGEMLIRADDEPAGIFYLQKGTVRQYAISRNGNELALNIFKPISFFPMSWAMNATQNVYYFDALTDVEVWKAPKNKSLEFIKNNPDVLYDLLARVYKGTDGILIRMAYLMSGNAYARLVTELLIYASRFGEKGHNERSFELKITESELASSAGMTRETVSREVKVLKDKGLISLKKNVILINNIDRLKDELVNDF